MHSQIPSPAQLACAQLAGLGRERVAADGACSYYAFSIGSKSQHRHQHHATAWHGAPSKAGSIRQALLSPLPLRAAAAPFARPSGLVSRRIIGRPRRERAGRGYRYAQRGKEMQAKLPPEQNPKFCSVFPFSFSSRASVRGWRHRPWSLPDRPVALVPVFPFLPPSPPSPCLHCIRMIYIIKPKVSAAHNHNKNLFKPIDFLTTTATAMLPSALARCRRLPAAAAAALPSPPCVRWHETNNAAPLLALLAAALVTYLAIIILTNSS